MKAGAVFLTFGLCLAPPCGAGDDRLLSEIKDLDAGVLTVRGFRLDADQEVRIEATDLEPRDSVKLTEAWILDARTRRLVWRAGDARPVKAYRGYRDYRDKLRLRAGTYEVYYATYPDPDEGDDERWWRGAGRVIRRFAEREILGHEDYGEAVERLRLAVRGSGSPLAEDDLEAFRRELRQQAVVSLLPQGDEATLESGFVLERPMELVVYALGEMNRKERFDYGWIVDARTQREVWRFEYDATERAGGASKNRVANNSLRLPAGRYAAFFRTDDSHSPEQWNALPPRDPAFWGLTVFPRFPKELPYAQRFQYRHLPEDRVIVDLSGLGNGESKSRGVTLEEPMKVRIFALGEGFKSGMADFGWIMDARSREIVWKMDFERTRPAGGSTKNRVVDEIVQLDAGDYVVVFVTDGSHAYRHWNSKPPPRGEHWGIMLLGGDDFDAGKVRPYREEEDQGILARLTRVTDGSHLRREISLAEPSRVAIYAVGEGSDGTMHDYGWLENAETGDVVWEMTYDKTRHAGGARKNRVFRGVIDLAPGAYVLHYVTDGSHAYGDWNEAAPHVPEAWGIRVALVRERRR